MKVAAGFVIFRKVSASVEYLMMQTSYGEHHWTPPKGHVDEGENDPLITAYRETLEESGLKKSDLKVFSETRQELHYKVKGKPKTVIYWLAELVNSAAVVKMSDEHQDFKWLRLKEACEYANYNDMNELLHHYDEYIKKNL